MLRSTLMLVCCPTKSLLNTSLTRHFSSNRLTSSSPRNKMTMPSETKIHHYETHPDIVWADCEMSGLDVTKDKLLEVAILITDSNLKELASLGPLIVNTDPQVLANMDEWCTKNHKKTGLYQACLQSKLTIQETDQELHDFLCSRKIRLAVLAGNSVSYDRQFLAKYCPKFSSLLHYRTIDVSSFKEIIRRWYPNEPAFKKKLQHRALEDIRESIDELRFYRSKYFKDAASL